jgi:membrane protease YdiL (CAAX protease family)
MTLPGIGEEIVFRGFLLTVLNDHFDKRFEVAGTRFGWGLFLVGVPFALAHMFTKGSAPHMSFKILGIGVYTFLGSCVLAFLKERSKSVWTSAIAHNFSDIVELMISRIFLH